jgi:AcrR family transcriptional regulator
MALLGGSLPRAAPQRRVAQSVPIAEIARKRAGGYDEIDMLTGARSPRKQRPVGQDHTTEEQPPRPSLREVQRAASRQHLVSSAREVFAKKGYIAATIDDLVSAARMSRATFYSHFSSKADLVQVIFEATNQQIFRHYGELDNALMDGSPEAFHSWIESTIEWATETAWLLPAWYEASLREPAWESRFGALIHVPQLVPRFLASRKPVDRPLVELRVRLMIVQLRAYFTRHRDELSHIDDRLVLTRELTIIWHTALHRSEAPAAPKTPAAPKGRGSVQQRGAK